ncbi:hypothetical protein [Nocardiopsis sp. LOL_012]|uniref:hypothetical protein n=1 Tax=Nocardiopsis sp. LOL_012 TaxID=3345409 RepID=UPI003A89C9AA
MVIEDYVKLVRCRSGRLLNREGEVVYDYDAAGNMVSRSTGERDQVLEWGAEGELVSVTDGLEVTSYVYDADGERLLRRANGATTLYLPGAELVWDPPAGTLEATRYYTHAGETVAVREDRVVSYRRSNTAGHRGCYDGMTPPPCLVASAY